MLRGFHKHQEVTVAGAVEAEGRLVEDELREVDGSDYTKLST